MTKADLLEECRKKCENPSFVIDPEFDRLVFGKGNPKAPILFIGEAPGSKEAEQGVPFVGAAGKQLDKLLSTIGLTLDDCYIANILKYRPPKNRDPQPEEIAAHTPFLVEQIKIIKPAIIATLGNFSTKFVLAGFSVDGMKEIAGVSQLHGQPKQVRADGDLYTVFPLYHPAAMLYKRSLTDTMEEDFVKMGEFLVNHLKTDTTNIEHALKKRTKDSQTTLL